MHEKSEKQVDASASALAWGAQLLILSLGAPRPAPPSCSNQAPRGLERLSSISPNAGNLHLKAGFWI